MKVEPLSRRDVVREVLFAVLAMVSVVIGFSRLVTTGTPVPRWVQVLDVAIALAFASDFVRRARADPRSAAYAFRHGWEVVTFIPFTLLPGADGGAIVRSVRLLRGLRLLRYGRFVRLGVTLVRLPGRVRYLQRVVDDAQVAVLFTAGLVTLAAGAAALLAVEGAVNPAVRTYGDAFWWALSVFTTTAYAAPDPVTRGGFLLTGSLMVLGMGFFGVFTASLASAILRSPRPVDEEDGV